MKIVLSRKGFDSSNGGVPSPILPDGRMISLPIPAGRDAHTMGDLSFDGINLGDLCGNLTRQKIGPTSAVHLDPDINPLLLDRPAGWRPAFGQSGGSQTHLNNHNVGVGDVFIFYGWFRQVEETAQGFRFVRGSPDMHVIFGWLQVSEVWPIVARRQELLAVHPAQAGHPHLATPDKYTNPRNTLYIARESLQIDGSNHTAIPGAGIMAAFHDRLRLTKLDRTRRHWKLPLWFLPGEGRPPLSHHPTNTVWSPYADHVELRSAAIGQEFVLDCDHYPEAKGWLVDLLESRS